jgi:hypothetical protein
MFLMVSGPMHRAMPTRRAPSEFIFGRGFFFVVRRGITDEQEPSGWERVKPTTRPTASANIKDDQVQLIELMFSSKSRVNKTPNQEKGAG